MATRHSAGELAAPHGRLRFDSFLTLTNQAGVGALNLAASVVVARALGPTGRGVVSVGVVLLTLLLQLGSLGIVTATPYFSARDGTLGGRLASAALWLAGAIGAILVFAVLILRAVTPVVFSNLSWLQVGIIVVTLPPALASIFLQSLLLGRGRTIAYNAVPFFLTATSFVALLAVALAGHLQATPALALLLGQYPVAVVIYMYLLANERPRYGHPDSEIVRRVVRFGLRSYASTVLSFLVIRLDLLMVNAYLGARQAGLYSVAVVLTQALIVFPSAISTNNLTRVARGALDTATARVFRFVAVIYGLMVLVAIPLAAPAIDVIFGAKFHASVRMFYWLLPGTFSLGMLTILSSHFAGRGYPARATVIWGAGLALNIIANAILLPLFGTYMASITSSVTYIAVLIPMMRLFADTSHDKPRLWPSTDELRYLLGGWRATRKARA
jgi:O-antigen/teichoic acid export membrane protein